MTLCVNHLSKNGEWYLKQTKETIKTIYFCIRINT